MKYVKLGNRDFWLKTDLVRFAWVKSEKNNYYVCIQADLFLEQSLGYETRREAILALETMMNAFNA